MMSDAVTPHGQELVALPDGTVLPGKTYMAYKDTWLYHFRQFWHYFADKPLHPSLNWQQYMAKHRQYSLKGD